MIIQWFPGHMHKAGKEIKQRLPEVDVVIEILDARIPYSSQNPLLHSYADHKPSIKVLNKLDLSDQQLVEQWQAHLEQSANIKTLAISTKQPESVKKILDLCRKMMPNKGDHQFITAMIMGIPNVGKSTIINLLANRIVAKTGNEPAVTKGQQRIKISDDVVFFDTPGMLWPRIQHQHWALRLAITGAIKETAMSHEDIAFYLVGYLMQRHPEVLIQRYDLDQLGVDEYSTLELIGAKRGCLKSRQILDMHKVSSILVHDFRSGAMGGLCIETPTEVSEEIEQARLLDEQREFKKQARKDAKSRKNKKRPK